MSKRNKLKPRVVASASLSHQSNADSGFYPARSSTTLEWSQDLGHALEPWRARLMLAAFLLLQSLWAFNATSNMPGYSDEIHHAPQVERFCRGDYRLSKEITSLPGYHVVASLYARAIGDCSLHALRGFNVVCGLLVTLAAFGILNALGSQQALARTAAFHFLPILFPYHFVVYTDVLSLLLALLTVLLVVKRRWLTAGIVGSLGILPRQQNVVILAFCMLLAAWESDRNVPLRVWLLEYTKKVWTSALGLAAFGCFVLINHGVALGDQTAHKLSVTTGNVYFALFLLPLVSLPVCLELIWTQRKTLWASATFLGALLTVYFFYMQTFRVEHPYNLHPVTMTFVRNILLGWAVQSQLTKMLFFVGVMLGFSALWVTRLARPSLWVWLPIAIAMLLPDSLIEQRYSILPLGLWMLIRKDAGPTAELLTALCNAVIAIGFLLLMSGGHYSL